VRVIACEDTDLHLMQEPPHGIPHGYNGHTLAPDAATVTIGVAQYNPFAGRKILPGLVHAFGEPAGQRHREITWAACAVQISSRRQKLPGLHPAGTAPQEPYRLTENNSQGPVPGAVPGAGRETYCPVLEGEQRALLPRHSPHSPACR
jgi:hypothetical protein